MSSNNCNNTKSFLFGFLAGGATGAIVALLTASKNGKELRGDIKQKSGEYMDEASKYFQETKIKAGELLTEGKKKYSTMMNDFKSKPDEILKDTEHVYNDVKLKTNNVLHSGKDKLDTEVDKLKSSPKSGMYPINENKKA